MDRKADVKGRSLAWRACDPDVASMGLDDVFYDREPEPGASGVAGSVLMDAVESLEDVGLVIGGDAGAVVGDGDGDLRGSACG